MITLKNFVVFEGGDGTGTTTQLRLLEAAVNRAGGEASQRFFVTAEPTDGAVGRLIRAGLRASPALRPETVAYLFAADRNEHLYGGPEGVAGRCGRGCLVVSDRYALSSLVYQGIACGEALPAALNREFPWPELTIYFDLDPRIACERMAGRPSRDIYERLDFQERARERYHALIPRLEAEGAAIAVVDAAADPEAVAARVWALVEPLLRRAPGDAATPRRVA